MKIRVQFVVESEVGHCSEAQDIVQIERDSLSPETLGLTLNEAKTLLKCLQKNLVKQQVAEYNEQQILCPHCQKRRRIKDRRPIVYRTPFGKLSLENPRIFHCDCQPHETKSFSPLSEVLAERTSPEFLYLQSKFSALMSYGLSVKLLTELLPIDEGLNAETMRNHTHQMAQRLESELGNEQFMYIDGCENEWAALPRPDMPLTVGIDGGYVRSCEKQSGSKGFFEVITGKSIADDGSSKCFGLVNTYDKKPKRRLFEILKSQGMQMNQQITFLSDGGDTVRDLQLYLNPQAEHILDWFHLTMRITVMNQMAKGIKHQDKQLGKTTLDYLESLKWYLWHGNVFMALRKIKHLFFSLDTDSPSPKQLKLLKTLEEFETYISNNRNFIPNYGERYRNGERISTGFVESTVNQVIAKRMVKKQQMRWSRKGVHLLLQVRTRVLDDQWLKTFERWYPKFDAKAA